MSEKHYEDLREKYRKTRDRINADPTLNFETKQHRIRAAGLEYGREMRELERNELRRVNRTANPHGRSAAPYPIFVRKLQSRKPSKQPNTRRAKHPYSVLITWKT
jgi:hypothetical protein